MTPDLAELCAWRIEELEGERDRWRTAYAELAESRMRWVETALKPDKLPVNVKARVRSRIKDALRRAW